ncbi:hypothetical protein IQ251_04910 [Saccharopolyspora sp. HNM0983]|uniref:Mce-associated membrane protein n=1 Tax=Saccharopolyspora montiporae TaxID=2781240 RepID=A0A929B7Q3_9PSEU|nr:hypothetical protein [Saccharopolyspora sp. HNM0983]MBE9373786.1 hypothetical protein [Saccharopolyspora sp. HNM0983]
MMRTTNTGGSTGRSTTRPRKVAGRSTGRDRSEVPSVEDVDTGTAAPGEETAGEDRGQSRIRRGAAAAVRPLARLRRPRVLITTAVIATLLLSTGYLAGQQYAAQQREATRAAALDSARRYAADLSTYDYRQLEQNFTAISENAHGSFADQYEQVGSSLTQLIKENEAVSEGSVHSAGLVESDENKAVVALFVDQKITNKSNPEPRVDRNRMQMTLVHQDDRWLIDGVELL